MVEPCGPRNGRAGARRLGAARGGSYTGCEGWPSRVSPVLRFDFHGVGVDVEVDAEPVRERVAGDFSYFRVAPETGLEIGLRIRAEQRKPDYDALPPLKAKVYTPRNICYPEGDVTYIDYFGRALSRYDRARSSLDVQCGELHLLHEVIFLSILSRVGELLERRRMHRVHALGVECGGEAALFLMPSGGGKTSLAMELLRDDRPFRILSEDSPLIDASGRVLPFPLRFGVKGERPEGFADEHIAYLERMEFDPKYLISLDAFEGRIATTAARPRFLFFGERTLGSECAVRPIGLLAGLRGLLRDMVVGVGLYQGVEFLFQSSALDLVRKTDLFVSRLRRALSLLWASELYAVELGRDPGHNARELIAFLGSKGFGGRSTVSPP